MKSGLLLSLATGVLAFSAFSAHAECTIHGGGAFPLQNDTVTFTAYVGKDGTCGASFGTGGLMFTGLDVLQNPKNGTVYSNGMNSVGYRAKPGFKGKDSFTVKVCASHRGEEGCSTVTYDLIME